MLCGQANGKGNEEAMEKGTIIKGIGGFYYVRTQNGTVYECKARGVFRKQRITPMVGDRVEIEIGNEKGSITAIEPRGKTLLRPAVANIDQLVIVAAAASPDPNLFLLDKMLVNAHISGIYPILCVNKTDLREDGLLREIYQKAGYRVISVCAEREENIGALRQILEHKVTAFAGLSGVGKSSLLNLLTEHHMETGAVSDRIGRGRHTTRHIELMELPGGGYVFDTPGFSSLEITGIKAEQLQTCFPEMDMEGEECRFRGCAHIKEPDCVIRERLERGEIAPSRYESYVTIYEALKSMKEWQ